ncbi:venom serine protease 34-like [Calliopsis andreniformis]|uniref:venom serine protease 34-like n=1 Tax=Calliopsis andreniformis TaxID=337506 RepID=UPI003FCD264B
MTKVPLLLLFVYLLTSFLKFGDAANTGCNYYEEIVAGNTYYVYNREYPSSYRGAQWCTWVLKSNYRVNVTCTLQIPWSYNCNQDVLLVQVSPNTTHRYCGNGSFSLESEGDTMTISLSSPASSTGGRFLCAAKLIENPLNTDENCRCGWKNPTRIVGGKETGVNEYPMMCGLVDSVLREIYCGCTIISPTYVVTAAHCFGERSIDILGVVVGEHDPSTGKDTNATALYRISRVVVHPNYNKMSYSYDIAVAQINGTISYSNAVGPACLPFRHSQDTFAGDYATILGWGTTEFAGAKSDTLQEATVNVITNEECSEIYRNLNRNQLCTYAPGKDACQMDSGGPVLWQNPVTRRLVLIGIISYGINCALVQSVQTRVSSYVNWIVSVTPGTRYCAAE